MPGRCVAAGCSNTPTDGVSLHRFPMDEKYRRMWIAKVRTTRPRWRGPTEHTVLCSAHFEDACFDKEHEGLYGSFGFKRYPKLLPDALPSKFPPCHGGRKVSEPKAKKRVTKSRAKRRHFHHKDGPTKEHPDPVPAVGDTSRTRTPQMDRELIKRMYRNSKQSPKPSPETVPKAADNILILTGSTTNSVQQPTARLQSPGSAVPGPDANMLSSVGLGIQIPQQFVIPIQVPVHAVLPGVANALNPSVTLVTSQVECLQSSTAVSSSPVPSLVLESVMTPKLDSTDDETVQTETSSTAVNSSPVPSPVLESVVTPKLDSTDDETVQTETSSSPQPEGSPRPENILGFDIDQAVQKDQQDNMPQRQTVNSIKGEVLLVCEEEPLSASQKLVYSKHDEQMKAYTKAMEAYNKAYANSNSSVVTADVSVTPASSVAGNGVAQNGVITQQQQPQQQQPPQQQQQTKQGVLIPVAPAKKPIVPSGTWQPQPQVVNKAAIPGNIPITSNIVRTQRVVPRVVNPINPAAQRTVIQVPVGTDLSGMQVISVPSSTGNYQLVMPGQVSYQGLTPTVIPANNLAVGNPKPVSVPVQSVVMAVSSSTQLSVPSTNQVVTPKVTPSTTPALQAVSIAKAVQPSDQPQASSQAGGVKRAASASSDNSKSKRSKSSETPKVPDTEENYYGWKQGRLWWDDDKPKGSFRCYICNKKLPSNIRYMQHVKHHLDKEQQQNSSLNDLISCRSCYKHFSTPHALQQHVEKSHKYCRHRCGICELACNDASSLMEHLSQQHPSLQMPYVCGVCNYASSIYDDLIMHFNKHHEGSKALMCPFCVRIIRCSNAFLRHCKTHLTVSVKNGLFRCRSCKLMFLNNTMLKEHIQDDHKSHSLQDRNGIPQLPALKGKPAEAVPVQKVTFPKHAKIKVSPSLWTRREIIKPRGRLRCMECGIRTEACVSHFRKKMSCNRCKYTTHCGTAFANHMIVFHKAGSAPKIHRIRKTVVNNGRILLGCRNCEFSTLSPTLMACHIESCPRGALTIESFKVRTQSLQTSRHFKREVMPVTVKTTKKDEEDDDDDDVIVIEDEVLVDLTDDAPSTSKEGTNQKAKPEESKSATIPGKVGCLTVKLEKLPDHLTSTKSVSATQNNKGDQVEVNTETHSQTSAESGAETNTETIPNASKETSAETSTKTNAANEEAETSAELDGITRDESSEGTRSDKDEGVDSQKQDTNTDEPTDRAGGEPVSEHGSGNSPAKKTLSENAVNTRKSTAEEQADGTSEEQDQVNDNVNDSDKSPKGKNNTFEDTGRVLRTREVRIKQEQIDSQ